MSGTRPGHSARRSRTGRPVMALLDLLGRRWVLRILWELREPAANFRELQARCGGMSSSMLAARLTDLRAAGVVERRGEGGYVLSSEGETLLQALLPLNDWAERWARRERAAD
jgi:DNA-binding HxlR family transcriptional regulator